MDKVVFVYLLDRFIPTDLTRDDVLRAFEGGELKPFELIKEFIEKFIEVKGVEVHDIFFERDEFLIEYLVESSNGKIGVKLIVSEDPSKLLMKYYSRVRDLTF